MASSSTAAAAAAAAAIIPQPFLPSAPSSSCSSSCSYHSLLPPFRGGSFPSVRCDRRRKRLGGFVVRAASSSFGGDYYATLRVSKSATSQDIKAAYRRLARQPGASEKFKEISAAYEVLSDDKKRSLYDQFGEAGVKVQWTNPFDLFETFFGPSMSEFAGVDPTGFRTSHSNTVAKGEDLRFSETISRAEKEFELSHLETCEVCAGTGSKVGSKLGICTTCGGRGQVRRTEQTPFGMFSQVSICPTCGGNGDVISELCRRCSGEGRDGVKKDTKVKIYPGVGKGSILRVAGEGDAGPRGGPPGDLFVYLKVKEIPEIQRDGINLSSMVTIGYLDAILGIAVEIIYNSKGCYTVVGSAAEHELLEELASLSGPTGNPPQPRPRTQMQLTAPTKEKKVDSDAEKMEEPEDKNDWLKKLQDLAGSVANGALKWIKDNL